MAKKQRIIASILLCLGVFFILCGAILPIILYSLLQDQVNEGVKLTDRSKWKLWGELPGTLDVIMLHEYHFFNVENPDEVLFGGAVPIITEKNGYIYQEFDTWLDIEYSDNEGTDKSWIHFFNWCRMEKTSHCVWRNNTHPSDKIMQISAGSFGAWDTMKHTPAQGLALPILYQVILGLNNALALGAYAQGVQIFIPTYNLAKILIYDEAQIDEELGNSLFNDPRFGMSKWQNIQVWINALQENTENGSFVKPTVLQGSLYVLAQYFGLTDEQIISIFNGNFKTIYDTVLLILLNTYGCEGDVECDPAYLGALQWSQSLITTEPPAGKPSQGPSIVSSNSSLYGYPEISYFMSATTIGDKYPNVTFTVDDYFSLFYYDRVTGWPKWSNHTLLDVGHFNHFWALGQAGDFYQIANDFNLTSEDHARVLWDYINALFSYTGLQGCTDQNIYNKDNRGIASEISLGNIGSQGIYQIWMGLAEALPIAISSVYYYIRLEFQIDQTCEEIVEESLPNSGYICNIPELKWGNNTETMIPWILTYWNGIYSYEGLMFQNLTELSDEDMETLFINSPLTNYFSQFDNEMKAHYGCMNAGKRCFGWDLAAKQWGRGYVTENLPEIFKILDIENTTSIYYLSKQFQALMPAPPEYYAYLKKNNINQEGLTDEQINNALTFDRLLGSSPLQKFFILDFEGNYTQMSQDYLMENPLDLLNYVRFAIDKFVFGGMFREKTVEQLLWTDYDPFLAKIQQTNPLLGGNPAIDPTQIQLGQNQTREMYEYMPKKFRHAENTGAKDLDEVRFYRLYNGQPYISVLQPYYFGESPWGSVVDWANINPWAELVRVSGSDSWNFQPWLTEDSDVTFYLYQASLVIQGAYAGKEDYRGFECLKYTISQDNLKNASQVPSQARFYQFGPEGFLNITSVMGGPIFGSKPYFLGADPVVGSLVQYTRPELNYPEEYESYINLEPYTGSVFYVTEKLMFSSELKPDALYPNLGKLSMDNTGYRTYLPLFFLDRTEEFDQSTVNKNFGALKTGFLVMKIIQILGYSLGSILIVAFGLYLLKLKINSRRAAKGWIEEKEEKEEITDPSLYRGLN